MISTRSGSSLRAHLERQVHKRAGPISALLLAVSVLLGCSIGGGTPTAGSTPSGTIEVWDFNYNTPAGKSYQQVDQNFMAKFPQVTVKHVAKPSESYPQVVQSAFAAKSGPDVLMLQTPFAIKTYAKALTPLNDLIAADNVKTQFNGWAGMNPDLNPNGKIYGIPYSFGASAFYYNKALFQKAGLDPSSFPTTYSDFIAAMDKLKAAGVNPPIGGGDFNGYLSNWWMGITVPGVMSFEDCAGLGNGKTKWSDPRMKTVLQDFLDLIKKGYLARNQVELNSADFSGYANWINGQAAVAWAFPGYRPVLAQNDATNLGTAPGVLAVDGPKPHFFIAGPTLGWTIPAFSKNKTAAWAYIKYITGTEAQQMHLDIDKVGPTNLNVDTSKADADLAATFALWKATGGENCARLWPVNVAVDLGKQMVAVETGQESLDTALQKEDALMAQNPSA